MPQVFKVGSYWVYFWANENDPLEPVHVHVCQGAPNGNATKIAPARIQNALYGTKISFQSNPSYKDSTRERSISTAFPRSCFSRRI